MLHYGAASQTYFNYNTDNLANSGIEASEPAADAAAVNACTFTANGKTYAPQLKDGLYYIEISDIFPQDLDKQITLTVTDAQGNILAVTYSPMNYIVRMNEKGSENLKNLLKALYNYHLAAKTL